MSDGGLGLPLNCATKLTSVLLCDYETFNKMSRHAVTADIALEFAQRPRCFSHVCASIKIVPSPACIVEMRLFAGNTPGRGGGGGAVGRSAGRALIPSWFFSQPIGFADKWRKIWLLRRSSCHFDIQLPITAALNAHRRVVSLHSVCLLRRLATKKGPFERSAFFTPEFLHRVICHRGRRDA